MILYAGFFHTCTGLVIDAEVTTRQIKRWMEDAVEFLDNYKQVRLGGVLLNTSEITPMIVPQNTMSEMMARIRQAN